MAARRRFGSIRKRESGRYQVRYPGPDGRQRTARDTFARKSDADRYLAMVEAQMTRGEWIDPERARVTLADYAERWVAQRPGLRPRTVALYRWLLGKHITPYLGRVELSRLDTPMIREWRAKLLGNAVSETMAAKTYRLLRAVLMTAVKEDELLRKNPCRIPGADQEKPAERPVLTLPQVLKLAELVDERYRALILVTTFACRRWGEVSALQRQDVDADAGVIRVRQTFTEVRGVGMVLGPPKSRAGRRAVSVPSAILPALREHLAAFVDDNPKALVSPRLPAGRSGAATSTRSSGGRRRSANSACRACTSMTCAHGKHDRGANRREHSGPDGADGARLAASGHDLPARHLGGGPGHRPGGERRSEG